MSRCDYMHYVANVGVLNPEYIRCANEAVVYYLGEVHNYWRDRCEDHTLDHAAVVRRYPSKEARDLELLKRQL